MKVNPMTTKNRSFCVPAVYGLILTTLALGLSGCVSLESKHKPSIENSRGLSAIQPIRPRRVNEWALIDVAIPIDSERLFRFDPEAPLQDLLDVL